MDLCINILVNESYLDDFILKIHSCIENINLETTEVIITIFNNKKIHKYISRVFNLNTILITSENGNMHIAGIMETKAKFICFIEYDYIVTIYDFLNPSVDVYIYNNFPIYNVNSLKNQYRFFNIPLLLIQKMNNKIQIDKKFITNKEFTLSKLSDYKLFKTILDYQEQLNLLIDVSLYEKVFIFENYFYSYFYHRIKDLTEFDQKCLTNGINKIEIEKQHGKNSQLYINILKKINKSLVPTKNYELDFLFKAKFNKNKRIYSNLYMINLNLLIDLKTYDISKYKSNMTNDIIKNL